MQLTAVKVYANPMYFNGQLAMQVRKAQFRHY